jgi:hypothetical protein
MFSYRYGVYTRAVRTCLCIRFWPLPWKHYVCMWNSTHIRSDEQAKKFLGLIVVEEKRSHVLDELLHACPLSIC